MSLSTLLRAAVGQRRCGVQPETEKRPIADFERLGLAAAPVAGVFDDDLGMYLPDSFPLDQSATGSCLAQFWCEAEVITMAARYGLRVPLPSRRFAYYWGRDWDGCADVDDGCRPSSLLLAVSLHGLPTETAFPWSVARINQRPPMGARWDAQDHVGQRGSYQIYYSSLQDRIDAVRAAVASGRAFGLAIPVTPDFERCNSAEAVPWDPKAPVRGYHMLTGLGCGSSGLIHCLNHWGPKHGVAGQVWLDPLYLAKTTSLIVVDPQEATK